MKKSMNRLAIKAGFQQELLNLQYIFDLISLIVINVRLDCGTWLTFSYPGVNSIV